MLVEDRDLELLCEAFCCFDVRYLAFVVAEDAFPQVCVYFVRVALNLRSLFLEHIILVLLVSNGLNIGVCLVEIVICVYFVFVFRHLGNMIETEVVVVVEVVVEVAVNVV